jgi:hypothetical protein
LDDNPLSDLVILISTQIQLWHLHHHFHLTVYEKRMLCLFKKDCCQPFEALNWSTPRSLANLRACSCINGRTCNTRGLFEIFIHYNESRNSLIKNILHRKDCITYLVHHVNIRN